jgi:hypothetical protein
MLPCSSLEKRFQEIVQLKFLDSMQFNQSAATFRIFQDFHCSSCLREIAANCNSAFRAALKDILTIFSH